MNELTQVSGGCLIRFTPGKPIKLPHPPLNTFIPIILKPILKPFVILLRKL